MMSYVIFQVTRLREPLIAHRARVGLLSCVDSDVSLEINELSEALVAVRTGVRFDVVVHHHVPLQVRRIDA